MATRPPIGGRRARPHWLRQPRRRWRLVAGLVGERVSQWRAAGILQSPRKGKAGGDAQPHVVELLGIVCREDLGRRAREHHAPAVEHRHEVGPCGVLHCVRDLHKRSTSGVEAVEDASQLAAASGSRPAVGSSKTKVRLHGEDAGKRADGAAARRRAGTARRRLVRKTHQVERTPRAGPPRWEKAQV